jgi:hypothetical protein
MYEKPEVTRYSGKELLDLMGPVETQYDCDLDGKQVGGCEIEFILQSPGGRELGDVFDDEEDIGIRYRLTGPCTAGDRSGVCTPGWDCLFPDPEPSSTDTEVPLFLDGRCDSPCDDGFWTLEVWWINDGEEYPSCSTTVEFHEGEEE